MTIDELNNIIKEYGICGRSGCFCFSGCELLGYVVDVGAFVSLLGDFVSDISFTDECTRPIETILDEDIMFYRSVAWTYIYFRGDSYFYSLPQCVKGQS
jgi:hypothetical protein